MKSRFLGLLLLVIPMVVTALDAEEEEESREARSALPFPCLCAIKCCRHPLEKRRAESTNLDTPLIRHKRCCGCHECDWGPPAPIFTFDPSKLKHITLPPIPEGGTRPPFPGIPIDIVPPDVRVPPVSERPPVACTCEIRCCNHPAQSREKRRAVSPSLNNPLMRHKRCCGCHDC